MKRKIKITLAGILAGVGILFMPVGCRQRDDNRISWVTDSKELEFGGTRAGENYFYATMHGLYKTGEKYPVFKPEESWMYIGNEYKNVFNLDNNTLVFGLTRKKQNKESYENVFCLYHLNKNKLEEICTVDSDCISYVVGVVDYERDGKQKGLVVRGADYKVIPLNSGRIDYDSLPAYEGKEKVIYHAEREKEREEAERLDVKSGLRGKLGAFRIFDVYKGKALIFKKRQNGNYDIAQINLSDYGIEHGK